MKSALVFCYFYLKEPPDATEICTNNELNLWVRGSKNCSISLTAPFPRFLTHLGIKLGSKGHNSIQHEELCLLSETFICKYF